MANKRLELVSRDSNDELNIAGDKDISQRNKMYSCEADVVEKKCTSEDDGAPSNWAGFPPHKHDEDNMPAECITEEVYYFLFDPNQGFAVQCLYTADGEIDEAYRVKNDELVEFPKGYHAAVSTPGYATYFLWLMAGEYQGFNRSNDPDHAWIG